MVSQICNLRSESRGLVQFNCKLQKAGPNSFIDMDWMRRMEGQMDGRTGGWMDEQGDRGIDGWTDR